MARHPEVFCSATECGGGAASGSDRAPDQGWVRLRRAGIVFAWFQGRPACEVAQMDAASARYVREVIHAFNEQGFAALDPKWSGVDQQRSAPRWVSGSAGSPRPRRLSWPSRARCGA